MKKKVLVVERDKDILELITYILEEEALTIIPQACTEGLLDRMLEIKPDAVILEVIDPSREITQVVRSIKKTPDLKDIPIIITSTYNDTNSLNKIGADGIIKKPFDIKDIVEIVKQKAA